MRRAARVDSTQKAIVKALRKAGAFVWVIGRPVDLAVFYRGWKLIEVKSSKRLRNDQEAQTTFCKTFDIPIVSTIPEALEAVGIVEHSPVTHITERLSA